MLWDRSSILAKHSRIIFLKTGGRFDWEGMGLSLSSGFYVNLQEFSKKMEMPKIQTRYKVFTNSLKVSSHVIKTLLGESQNRTPLKIKCLCKYICFVSIKKWLSSTQLNLLISLRGSSSEDYIPIEDNFSFIYTTVFNNR